MSIDAFEGLRPLLPAEKTLIEGLGSGRFDLVEGGGLPDPGSAGREIRAALLRLLLVGAPGAPAMHEKGVRVSGAHITGPLDLEGCLVPRDIGLVDCRFEAPLILRSAIIHTLFLDGSILPGFLAERLEARGDLLLRSAVVDGAVVLPGARIGGGLVLDGASVQAGSQIALQGAGLEARGGIQMRGSRIGGGISLPNGWLLGDLDATGAEIVATDGPALAASGIDVRGDIQLQNARMRGTVALIGARCRGDLDLTAATLDGGEGPALTADRAEIGGAFVLRGDARIEGLLSLNAASIGVIVDDPGSWPGVGDLALNRCRYDAILDSDLNVESRLDWLERQVPALSGEDFWPGPYEQLADVLLQLGHNEDARRVLFEKEKLQRRARRARTRSRLARALLWCSDALLRITLGYGRRPMRAIAWLGFFWITGTALLVAADQADAVRPNVAVVLRSPEWIRCAVPDDEMLSAPSLPGPVAGLQAPGSSQMECYTAQPEAASFPDFNPFMFVVDTLLPAVDTGQRDFWAPDGRKPIGALARAYAYFLTIMGWALGLLAVAGFTGLVRSR